MKHISIGNTRFICLLAGFIFFSMNGFSNNKKPVQEFYEIKIYHFKTADQEKALDDYLQHALLPALHKMGIGKTGVFKPLANDTAMDKLIYVFMPLKSFEQLLLLPGQLEKDPAYNTAGGGLFKCCLQ